MRKSLEASYVAYVEARQPYLRRIAHALCGDWHRADDLLQTALVKLYVAWPRVRRDGREDAYVRQIMVRSNIDELRRGWSGERVDSAVAHADRAAPEQPGPEERDELFTALQQLPQMQRKVVVLRHWLDLSVTETATELGISEGTVKSHSSRAVAALERVLAGTS